ncbi:MAG: DNA-binding protein WhiA, partial [Clostridia bacterium]|nr:DNA-binding protein WhiA [Clostridia bacterium]
LFFETFGVELTVARGTKDRRSGRDKLILQCPYTQAEELLNKLLLLNETGDDYVDEIPSALLATDEGRIGYLKGAFLGGGSCVLPTANRGGYHLEIVFFKEEVAKSFCMLLEDLELLAKIVKRKETYVVYVKSKEAVSDFLSVLGAKNCLKKFNALVESRDESNQTNRASNCFSYNMEKTASSSVKQIQAITLLKDEGLLDGLGCDLKDVATARIERKMDTLQELADYLGVSKSCLNHRLRKLISLADKAKNKREKKEEEI